MNSFSKSLRRAFALLAVVVSLGGIGSVSAADAPGGTSVGTIAVPADRSDTAVRDAVLVSLSGRGWTINEKTDGKITAFHRAHRNEATVWIVYDTKQIEIFCEGYEINAKTGERKHPELPAGWLKYLRQDISRNIGAPIPAK